jgi:hypothetical protein
MNLRVILFLLVVVVLFLCVTGAKIKNKNMQNLVKCSVPLVLFVALILCMSKTVEPYCDLNATGTGVDTLINALNDPTTYSAQQYSALIDGVNAIGNRDIPGEGCSSGACNVGYNPADLTARVPTLPDRARSAIEGGGEWIGGCGLMDANANRAFSDQVQVNTDLCSDPNYMNEGNREEFWLGKYENWRSADPAIPARPNWVQEWLPTGASSRKAQRWLLDGGAFEEICNNCDNSTKCTDFEAELDTALADWEATVGCLDPTALNAGAMEPCEFAVVPAHVCDSVFLGPDLGLVNIMTYNDADGSCEIDMQELQQVCSGAMFQTCMDFLASSEPAVADVEMVRTLTDADNGGLGTSQIYRVSVILDDSQANIYKIFGDTPASPMRFPPCIQNTDPTRLGVNVGGVSASNIIHHQTTFSNIAEKPDLANDSWVTVGITEGDPPTGAGHHAGTPSLSTSGSLNFDTWDASTGIALYTENGSVFWVVPDSGPSLVERCTMTPGYTWQETAEATTCSLTAADAAATPPVPGSCAVSAGQGTCTYVAHSQPRKVVVAQLNVLDSEVDRDGRFNGSGRSTTRQGDWNKEYTFTLP